MVRYEKFGLGATWNVEYGSADDPEEFGWLLGYSPYHHVREGVDYPATLFTVFDGDTRVDPLHARKMCAALQHATSRRPARPAAQRDGGRSRRPRVSRTVALAPTRWRSRRAGRACGCPADLASLVGDRRTRSPGGLPVPFAAVPTAPLSASLSPSLPEAIRFRSCVDDKQTDTLCDRVYDLTGVDWLAESAD